jgi:hypothetical protein
MRNSCGGNRCRFSVAEFRPSRRPYNHLAFAFCRVKPNLGQLRVSCETGADNRYNWLCSVGGRSIPSTRAGVLFRLQDGGVLMFPSCHINNQIVVDRQRALINEIVQIFFGWQKRKL